MEKYILCFIFYLFASCSCLKAKSSSDGKNDTLTLAPTGKLTSVLSGYSLVWEDNFDTFNSSNWSVGMRDSNTGDLIPGAHGDYLLAPGYDAYVTAEDTYVSGGSLVLRNQKRTYTGISPAGTYSYTTGWVNSMHKVYLNKGYIEVRAQFPSGDKVWPAIWLCAEDLVWGPEWDLWEYFGYRSEVGYDNMGMHLAYGTSPNIIWSSFWLGKYDATYNCEAWHVYGFEWTATYAKWYIDGVEVRMLNNTIKTSWPNENMYLVLNNETQTSASDATTTWPNSLIIDYIQIYQKK